MTGTVLLLQTREPDDPVLAEERESFAEKSDLAVERIVPHDLLTGPPALDELHRHGAVMIGGSGDYYVSKGHLPDLDRLLGFFRELAESAHPTFASCFGFQLLVQALGGHIVHDTASMEVGTYELTLTEAGRQDPLLGTLPPTFMAQLGRKDRADRLPPGCVNLASSARCALQAFRLPGKPIWATQFHPELDGHTNRGRYLRYLKGYAEHLTPEEQEEALSRYQESPQTEGLLRSFLALVGDG